MATTVTVKGQVTIPKAVREAAGIRPGDRVEVRAGDAGEIVVERAIQKVDHAAMEQYRTRLEEVARLKPMASGPLKGMDTDEIMALLRGED